MRRWKSLGRRLIRKPSYSPAKTPAFYSFRATATGCSSGFGELTAKTLAEGGYEVYAAMRETEQRNAAAASALRDWAAACDRAM